MVVVLVGVLAWRLAERALSDACGVRLGSVSSWVLQADACGARLIVGMRIGCEDVDRLCGCG